MTDKRAVLKPGIPIRPKIDLEQCREILLRLYGLECQQLKELNGYDDRNFLVVVKGESGAFKKYVFKVMNSLDSKNSEFFEGQNALLLFLAADEVKCPVPVENLSGKYFSSEKLESGDHVVRLMVYVPGTILHEIPTDAALFYQAGKYIANVDNRLEGFHHKVYDTHKTLWMLDSLPELREYLDAVKDPRRRQMVEDVMDEFEKKVLTKRDVLPSGIIHGDFNEQNVVVDIVDGRWMVTGLLDFGDVNKACYLYELAIAMAYMMIISKDLDVGGHVLSGYIENRDVSELEISLLKVCVEARLCQSLVLGAYSSLRDPENPYLLTTSAPGWELLTNMRDQEEETLLNKWRTIFRENQRKSNETPCPFK